MPNAETVLGGLELDAELVNIWELLGRNRTTWRTNLNYLRKINRYIKSDLIVVEDGVDMVVNTKNGVKIGKLDPNDPYYPDEMRVKGEVSKRHFDPDDAGGLITKKTWNNVIITQNGIDDITTHLSRFGPDADNAFMIDRLKKILGNEIQISDYDKRFYTHELEEFTRYKNKGIPNGVNDQDFYYNAHTASLETFSVNEISQPLYYPR